MSVQAVAGFLDLAVIHNAIPGRVRLRVKGLKGARRLKNALEDALRSVKTVRAATANATTGTLLIVFDADSSIRPIFHAAEETLRRYQPGVIESRRLRGRQAHWHTLPSEDVLKILRSSMAGLSAKAFQSRLRRYGENTLPGIPARDRLEMLMEQFQSLPVALLIGAAALSLATGGVTDALVVLSVVALNAGIGFVTESRAELAVRALARPLAGSIVVLREGVRETIPAECAVPGDLLELRPGVIVPADARVISSEALMINEATLTGESAPVEKNPRPLPSEEAPLADRANIVYRGTIVTGGSGLAVVVATGAATEIGKVQTFLESARPPETPLQIELGRLGRQLTLVAGVACGLVFLLGLLRGYGLFATFKNAIALAVAAVPEGLPTLATTTLALGVREMRRSHVLVRRLDAVETLASVRIICLDKTGTLTFNRMSVAGIWCGGRAYFAEADAISAVDGRHARLGASPALRRLAEILALCQENPADSDGNAAPSSATEAALLQLAQRLGVDLNRLKADFLLEGVSYRSEQQLYMQTLHKEKSGRIFVAVKGSPEVVAARCAHILLDDEPALLTEARRHELEAENARLAKAGQRVLGVAYAEYEERELAPGRLIFVGLVGLADPLRPGVAALLREFRRAGISPVMLTGDQKTTAEAIARDLDLGNGALRVADAAMISDLGQISDPSRIPHVFARVTPGQKLKIVETLQRSGLVVAMTGDGVNDSPALKAADIGVAMGLSGSEAAREVSHIVLEDDNLKSLIPAIRQGRATHANIRRAIRYLLATNMSEILLMLIAPLANLGQPLTPAQLLWINLVTDVAPALALGLEPPHEDSMRLPPAPSDQAIVDFQSARTLGFDASLITAGSVSAYAYGIHRYGLSPRARTISFVSIIAAQLLHALSCRSQEHSVFSGKLPPNPTLAAVIAGSFALQVATLTFSPLRRLLGLAALGPMDIFVALATGAAPVIFNEFTKAARGSGTPPRTTKIDVSVLKCPA